MVTHAIKTPHYVIEAAWIFRYRTVGEQAF